MARLKHSGSTRSLRRQLFPRGFAGEVMVLISETWHDFCLNTKVYHETPITAVFRQALIEAYRTAGRSWFISLEDPITEPHFGTELGRNDLRFYPLNHCGQTVFFTVECKRLRVKTSSRLKSLAGTYVNDGMLRFVNGQYSAGLPCGGMIGYVMDNNLKEAFASVRKEIESKRDRLKISSKDALRTPSATLPDHEWSADTFHKRAEGVFALHHALLGVTT
jgi:hypothetical protein